MEYIEFRNMLKERTNISAKRAESAEKRLTSLAELHPEGFSYNGTRFPEGALTLSEGPKIKFRLDNVKKKLLVSSDYADLLISVLLQRPIGKPDEFLASLMKQEASNSPSR